MSCDSLYRAGVWGRDGSRRTGSAYQAMDVLISRDSLYRVGVRGRDYTIIFHYSRLADCSIFRAKINQKHIVFTGFFDFLGVSKINDFGKVFG